MKLKPLVPAGRSIMGVNFGFVIHRQGSRKHPQLNFSISQPLMRAMKWNSETILRLDGDLKDRVAALVIVDRQSKSARKCHVSESGRGKMAIPCTGEVAEAFPPNPDETGMQPLTILEQRSDCLIFELPALPEKKA
jgi:hypothetical protein